MKNNKFIKGFEGIFIFIIFILLLSFVSGQSASSTFDLNSLVMKSTLIKDTSLTKVLTINKGSGQTVNLEVIGLKGVSLSETQFILNDVKNIQVKFDSTGLDTGIYVGSIKVSDISNVYYLPVILEVESDDVIYDANLDIPPAYSTISPGEKLIAQVKIFDLTSGGTGAGLGANSISVEYSVKSVKGEGVSSETENLVVDKQSQVTKSITFPKTMAKGEYVFSVVVRYKGSTGIASYLFTVDGVSGAGISGLFDGISSSIVAIAILVLAFFFALAWLFIYSVKDRDKMILEMKEHMENDYNRSLDLIQRQEKALRAKGVPEKVIKVEKEKKIRKLEVKHVAAKKHVEKLKHTNNKKSMEKQLMEWKKRGYNTQGMEYKLSGLSTDEMKKIIKEWKEEYR